MNSPAIAQTLSSLPLYRRLYKNHGSAIGYWEEVVANANKYFVDAEALRLQTAIAA